MVTEGEQTRVNDDSKFEDFSKYMYSQGREPQSQAKYLEPKILGQRASYLVRCCSTRARFRLWAVLVCGFGRI
jgi:hypothetical protein